MMDKNSCKHLTHNCRGSQAGLAAKALFIHTLRLSGFAWFFYFAPKGALFGRERHFNPAINGGVTNIKPLRG